MKILSSMVLTILLFSFSLCMASELQTEFHLLDADQVVKEGDIVEGLLKVWPIENVDASEFKKLQNRLLFNAFYLIDVISVSPSENNADVIEMKASFIVQGNKEITAQNFSYKGKDFLVAAPALKVEKAEASEDYYVLEQSISYSNATLIMFGALLVFIIVIVIIKREKLYLIIRRFRNDPKTRVIKEYKELFNKAKTREDFEKIYAQKKEWFTHVEIKTPAFNEFFKTMENHQYKKTWGPSELSEVQSSFDSIRGSFK